MKHDNRLRLSLVAFVLCGFAGAVNGETFQASSWLEVREIERRVRAAHFLAIATFGPTTGEIEALAEHMEEVGNRRAFSEWIDEQFAMSATYHEPLVLQMVEDDGFDPLQEGINEGRYKHHAWWHTAIAAPDQLRQRMAWALSQIFVINQYGVGFTGLRNDASGKPQWLGVTNYYDMLIRHAFGNYRDVLGDVTLHPIMGVFLSHVKNPKGDPSVGRFPDENYAREVMQLLSVGLYEQKLTGQLRKKKRELIDTYDNETIKSFARVFTGLSYAGGSSFERASRNYHEPMEMYEEWHDTDPKTLLRGRVLPGNQTGMQDVNAALDNLFENPNVAPFLSRLLIQRFVKSNPSKNYIRRVARKFLNNGRGVRGDFKAMIKAILLDQEAIESQTYRRRRRPFRLIVGTRGTENSRLREPVLRYTAFIRAFEGTSDYPTGRFMLRSRYTDMNQAPYRSPSVFNFYLPDFQPPGDIIDDKPSRRVPNGALVAPEFGILTAVTANRFANRLRSDVRDAIAQNTILDNSTAHLTCNVSFDFSPASELASDPAELMSYLDLLLCHGTLPDAHKEIIANALTGETSDSQVRAKGAILAVLTDPACVVAP